MSNTILYEQPLNERIRVFLRLEHLFSQVTYFKNAASVWDAQASISVLMEILTILDRTDVRSEVLKELDRHISGLSKYIDLPNIDHAQLDLTLSNLHAQLKRIQNLPAKIGSEIRESDLLNSVRQRTVITGGTCGFDIPAYHYWLNQPVQDRVACLTRWVNEMNPLKESIELILTLTRKSAFFDRKIANMGFFQSTLVTQSPCQLLRISLPVECRAYPEVSGNKHRVNVRFLAYTETGRPKQIAYNLEFDMSSCAI